MLRKGGNLFLGGQAREAVRDRNVGVEGLWRGRDWGFQEGGERCPCGPKRTRWGAAIRMSVR